LFFYEWLPILLKKTTFALFINLRIEVTYVLLSNLLASLIVLLLLLPEYFRVKYKFNIELLREILLYSLPLLVSGLAGIVNETLDRILLKHLIRDSNEAIYALGIYGANYKIAILLLIFIQMFRYAIEPFYFNYYKNKDHKEVYAQIMRLFIGIMIVLCMIIIFYIDFIKFFIHPKFHEGLKIVPIILISYTLYGIFFNLSIWYKLTKRTKYAIILTSIGASVTIIVNLVFVSRFSYMASAYGHLCSYTVMVLLSFFIGQKFFKIDYGLNRIIEYVLIALVIFALQSFIDGSILKYLLSGVIIIGYCYYIIKREGIIKNTVTLKWK
jgi:O-antigen/teichoic acid export membrane protein